MVDHKHNKNASTGDPVTDIAIRTRRSALQKILQDGHTASNDPSHQKPWRTQFRMGMAFRAGPG